MSTLRKIQLGMIALATLSTICNATETQPTNTTDKSMAPKLKMTTATPLEITTPDIVESRLGTLHFKNGMPDQDTIKKVYDNLDISRAVEVYLNMLPAISMWSIRKGQRDSGGKDNTITIMETLMDSTGMYLTPNTETPQTWVSLDLSKGPMVLETPPNVIGVVDDMLFHYVTDFGMLGPDKNKGGKFLFLPPGYKGEIPKGYFVFKSPTFGLWAPWRNIAVNGDIKPALENIKKYARIYPLSEADKEHKEIPSMNGSFNEVNTIPPNTYLYWEYLNDLIQEEPVGIAGSELTGQIAAIGIVKGKPFSPDAHMKKILTEAVAIGNATARAITFQPRNDSAYLYGKKYTWYTGFQGGYKFEDNGARNLDGRVAFHYFATGITPAMEAKNIGAGSQYAIAPKDSKGNWLDGSKNYKLTLPANSPQKNFWSVIVYDSQTRSLLQTDDPYPSIGAGKGYPNKKGKEKVRENADGSIDLYFGPKTPEGKKSNWIQTVPGKGWFAILRMYSPLEPWFDRTWQPGEFEEIK